MEFYDPDKHVNPEEWMEVDEGERRIWVENYHHKKRIKLPDFRMHAIIHVIVENQIAMGSKTSAQKTLVRLMRDGLSRHDAVHAIGLVLAEYMFDLMKHGAKEKDVNAAYDRQLEELSAKDWLNRANEDLDEE